MMQTARNTEQVDRSGNATSASVQHPDAVTADQTIPDKNVVVDCGWGRLIMGRTFSENSAVVTALEDESAGERDVAFDVKEPHVLLALAPQQLFLDPSHTYRLPLQTAPEVQLHKSVKIRPIEPADALTVRRIYLGRRMIPPRKGFFENSYDFARTPMLAAEDSEKGNVLGVVMGVDHVEATGDEGTGASLWALASDPQTIVPGIGAALTMAIVKLFKDRGRAFLDLSVMHDNKEAIGLYEKLGFQRVPIYSVKRKNPFNEKLFVGPETEHDLNIYAQILVDEARRRGIGVEVLDAEHGFFRLNHGGRVITCRESLCDLTSAVAMSRCDDKVVTRRLLTEVGLRMPAQIEVNSDEELETFLSEYDRVVVKPARGEQGRGVFVDISDLNEAKQAIQSAREVSDRVILEQYVTGEDLRIIVIKDEVVAAAIRCPPDIRGDGVKTIRELIESQSRRRQAATRGESKIPVDDETQRCIASKGFGLDDVLPADTTLRVRKTANLHTGGTIHDVTSDLHPALRKAAVLAARTLEIPVVGMDFLVTAPDKPDYVIIEANERPGLANHEPQPTAQRFIDFLFPRTATTNAVGA
jgi:GNAT-family acetyltransferase (TIGR03103 family)